MEVLIAPIGAALLVFLSATVQHLSTVISRGVGFVMTDRSAPLSAEGFSGRAKRTLQNNLESAAMMVPLGLTAAILGEASQFTITAAYIYVGTRIGFTLCYWFGISVARSVFWGVGMATIVTIGISTLGQYLAL